MHLWVQKFYPALGLGSGRRLLRGFQTPVLYWINFSLRCYLILFSLLFDMQKKPGNAQKEGQCTSIRPLKLDQVSYFTPCPDSPFFAFLDFLAFFPLAILRNRERKRERERGRTKHGDMERERKREKTEKRERENNFFKCVYIYRERDR